MDICPSCGEVPDFRGIQKAHVKNKGMGGDPKGLRKETVRECARCHSERHGIKEVKSRPMWSGVKW